MQTCIYPQNLHSNCSTGNPVKTLNSVTRLHPVTRCATLPRYAYRSNVGLEPRCWKGACKVIVMQENVAQLQHRERHEVGCVQLASC